MSTLAQRLALAMHGPPKVRPIDLARACDVKQPSVSGWLSGKSTRMEGVNLLAAAEFLKVNYWWLADGREPMRPRQGENLNLAAAKDEATRRPKWPFPAISEPEIAALPAIDRHRIEGAPALAIAQVGMKVNVGTAPEPSRRDQAAAIVREASTTAANDADYIAIRKVGVKIAAGIAGFDAQQQRDDGTGGSLFLARQWVEKHRYRWQALLATTVKRDSESMLPRIKPGDIIVFNTDDTIECADGVFAVNHEGEFTLKRLKKRLGHWWLYSDNEDQSTYPPVMCSGITFIIGRVILMHSEQL